MKLCNCGSERSKSKILIISQWFVLKEKEKIIIPGGTERYAYGLAKQLQSDGYDVTILSATTNEDKIGISKLDGFYVYIFKVPKKYYGYLADFLSFLNALKIIRMLNPDLVHIISSRYRFAAGAILASKILRKKTIFTLTLISVQKKRELSHILYQTIFSRIIKGVDIIILLSNEMKDTFIRNFPTFPTKKILTIPSFFIGNYYKKTSKERNSILFVGRLEIKQKGVDLLLRSLIYVKKKLPNFKLHIVGKGSSLDYLVKIVSDYNLKNNVVFHGYVDENELIELYSTNEIFVLSSLYEGMPIVLLEAMSAGLPIIAFDIGPAVEALDHGKDGILVKKGDIEGLANAIIKLLEDHELRKYFSKMSLERSKKYSQSEIVRQIEKIYSELIEAHLCE